MKTKIKNIILIVIGSIIFFLIVGIRLFGVSSYVVGSDSMAPSIRKYAIVYTFKVKQEKIDIGDVIVIRTTGVPRLHAVEAYDDETVTTKGTANKDPDDPVSWELYDGKMLYQIPYLGVFVKSIYPWIIVFLLGSIGVVIKVMFKYAKK